jgi:OOP family OmpA-OmpF porin
MKKMILAAVALCCATSAMAGDTYVGASVGRSKLSADLNGFAVSQSSHDTAYKLFGGYQFTPNFGVEGGFADLGKLDVSTSVAGSPFTGDAKARSLYVAATGTLPLTDKFSVSGKLGLAETRTTISAHWAGFGDASESRHRGSLLAGVGASYALNEKVSLVAEYENFGKVAKDDGDHLKAEMVSVGVRMKF